MRTSNALDAFAETADPLEEPHPLKRWRDHYTEKLVHAVGAIARGEFTLCGRALEGVNGDEPMTETRELIQCPACEAIIAHCKLIKPSEINPRSRRRLNR